MIRCCCPPPSSLLIFPVHSAHLVSHLTSQVYCMPHLRQSQRPSSRLSSFAKTCILSHGSTTLPRPSFSCRSSTFSALFPSVRSPSAPTAISEKTPGLFSIPFPTYKRWQYGVWMVHPAFCNVGRLS